MSTGRFQAIPVGACGGCVEAVELGYPIADDLGGVDRGARPAIQRGHGQACNGPPTAQEWSTRPGLERRRTRDPTLRFGLLLYSCPSASARAYKNQTAQDKSTRPGPERRARDPTLRFGPTAPFLPLTPRRPAASFEPPKRDQQGGSPALGTACKVKNNAFSLQASPGPTTR